jgi:hypothetical protein
VASGLTRRAVLAASAAAVPLAVSACRGVQVLGTPPPPAPDVRTLRFAITAEQLLIARYHTAIAAASAAGAAGQPAAAGLTAILAEHEQHLSRLRARLIEPPGSAGSPAASRPGAGPSGAGEPTAASEPTTAGGLAATIAALAGDEQAAARRLTSQLLTVPGSLAQLMASICASEVTHVPVLRALERGQ